MNSPIVLACWIFLITFQILTFLQRMNNARADMFHDLVCEHRKLSDAHSKLQLELSKKGNLSRHTAICRISFLSLLCNTSSCRHIILCRHSAAGTEEQVAALLTRVKELTGMPDPAFIRIDTLYFKSFNLCHCFLSSNACFDFKSFQTRKLHWRPATRTVCPQWT
jgi:hypothetical protein